VKRASKRSVSGMDFSFKWTQRRRYPINISRIFLCREPCQRSVRLSVIGWMRCSESNRVCNWILISQEPRGLL
jgi:hypothetical protein